MHATQRGTRAPTDRLADDLPADGFTRIEVTGVLPDKEPIFRTHKLGEGRFLLPTDKDAIVIERLLAREFKLGLGDAVLLRHSEPPQPARRFEIVGIIDRRRASANQAMMTWAHLRDVQQICKLHAKIKAIDIIVSDPTVQNIQRIASEVRHIIDVRNAARKADDRLGESLIVKTTEAQHKKLGAARGLLQFIMMLLSCVVMLTGFFIILATMSMGVTEQVTELGLLRCIGVTRHQLGGLVLLQTVPMGLVGTLLGVPLGLALLWYTVHANPEYLGEIAISRFGLYLAVGGGLGTTLFGAALTSFSAFGVSPADAARAHTGGRFRRWVWLAAGLGVLLIVMHELLKRSMVRESALFDAQAVTSVLLLYLGAALTVPAFVILFGRLAVVVVAAVLRLQPHLLGDEIARSPFRAASICSGLMVALSLIVGLIVWGRSVKEGWQFPKEFPDAMLYSYDLLPLEDARALRHVDGVADFTVTDDFPFSLKKPPEKRGFFSRFSLLDQFSRFLAFDPEEGFAIIRLAFLEGDEPDAVAKLERGGHILVTREFAQAHDKHLGDKVTIWVRTAEDEHTRATFTVAGVVASPGLDIAISFFNASTYFQTYAVGAIFGTLDDAQRLFGRSYGRLMLFNFDLPDTDVSRIYSDSSQAVVPKTRSTRTGRPTFAAGSGPVPGDGPEERVVNKMLEQLGYPSKAFVTARELKQKIDRSIDRVTLLLSAIPAIGLVVAALGVANLMAAGVAARTKQIAVLRALGVTKAQMARIVIGEALVLGLLGSIMGLALGFYLGHTSNFMTELLSGFRPEFAVPWLKVCLGAGLATGLCLLAALIPAHYASRSNIVAALSDL